MRITFVLVEVFFCHIPNSTKSSKWCLCKIKEKTAEMFEMLRNAYGGECFFLEQAYLNGMKGLEKCESCCKMKNRRAVLQLLEQMNKGSN
jgi:hypothetical protein